jgi:2-haloacid dehalogenase
MAVQAVVFDIGNVLVRWDPDGFYDRLIGPDARQRLFAETGIEAMNIGLDNGDPWLASVTALADQHPEWRAAILCWYYRWPEMFGPMITQTVRCLRALKGRGVLVYGLTNFGGESYPLACAMFPFLNLFDDVAVSGDLRLMKPDPAIYVEVERFSGLTGGALLFADDKAENIAAAAARGWATHHFSDPAPFAARLVAEGLLSAGEAQ